MNYNVKHWWKGIPNKGGVLGAVIGALFSTRYHEQGRPLRNAGKTSLFAGSGFILGDLIEKFGKEVYNRRSGQNNDR